jgi:hypothetical protein
MSDRPEFDEVNEARRQVAAHAQFSVTYWVINGVVLVLLVSIPIWLSWMSPTSGPYVWWGIAALAVGLTVHSWNRRRRSGVHLPKRVGAYPSARPIWLAGVAVTLVGYGGIHALVDNGQRGSAFLVLPVVAIALFVIQVKIRSAMRRDLEAGRVRP